MRGDSMKKESFVLYNSFYEPIRSLSKEDKASLLDAIFQYQINGNIPTLSISANMAFMFIKSQFERDNEKYKKRCEKNAANARMRWDTNACERIQTNANDADDDGDDDLKKNIKKKFSKPTIDEIREYCKERNNNVNPAQFYDHYEASGWRRGKTPLKDWRAAVRLWERNSTQINSSAPKMEEF